MNARLRRLEKTVEALSHGLILALTQLKSESGGRSGDDPRAELHGLSCTSPSECDEAEEATPADATDSLSTTLARMQLSENSAENLYATLSTFRRPTDHGWLQRALKPWHRRNLIESHVLTRNMTTASAPLRQETTRHYSLARTGPLSPGCLAPS